MVVTKNPSLSLRGYCEYHISSCIVYDITRVICCCRLWWWWWRLTQLVYCLYRFQFVSEEVHRGVPCLKYVRRNRQYNKTNTYSFFITKDRPHKPLRYEMHGYDDLMTSHYDHYILDYNTFEPWKFNFSLFELPKSKSFFFTLFTLSLLLLCCCLLLVSRFPWSTP